jgi:hypothetical protein
MVCAWSLCQRGVRAKYALSALRTAHRRRRVHDHAPALLAALLVHLPLLRFHGLSRLTELRSVEICRPLYCSRSHVAQRRRRRKVACRRKRSRSRSEGGVEQRMGVTHPAELGSSKRSKIRHPSISRVDSPYAAGCQRMRPSLWELG